MKPANNSSALNALNALNPEEIWKAARGELEVVLSGANFKTWFKNTFIKDLGEKKIIIGVPNTFTKERLEKNYHDEVFSVLKKFHPTIESYECTVTQIAPAPLPLVESQDTPSSSPILNSNIDVNSNSSPSLNNRYSFQNFIVGNSNRLAVATAQAVAKSPGKSYNPLFIYGGVGLGKTHLVCAIGNEIKKKNPKINIVYASCEKFTNDYINSISSKKTNEFKKNYRNADILVVDDIQFMSGKDGTQEEFFHTFNALHQKDRQIIITSDRVPKAIPQMTDRLSSRFGWGMVADIQPPNLEMRQAILRSKCEEKKYNMSDDVLDYIAQNIESNIRELEGAINRVASTAELNKTEPSLDLTIKCLKDIITAKNQNLTVDKVVATAIEFFKISNDDLMSGKRNQGLVRPRQIIMYLLRHELNLSYPKIGQHLNKKDHTTVIYGVEKIEKEIARDDELHKQLTLIKEKLRAF